MQHWWPEQLCTEIETKLSSSSYSEFPLLESLLDHHGEYIKHFIILYFFIFQGMQIQIGIFYIRREVKRKLTISIFYAGSHLLYNRNGWPLWPNVNARTIAQSVTHNTKYLSTKICVYIISLLKWTYSFNLNKTETVLTRSFSLTRPKIEYKTLEHHSLTLCAFHSPYKLWKFTLMLRIQLKW